MSSRTAELTIVRRPPAVAVPVRRSPRATVAEVPKPLVDSPKANNVRGRDSLPDLLPLLSAGEPNAAQEVMDRYGGLVWSLARRHSPTPADAEDAVQDIFLAIWKNAEKFDATRASEASFVAMIARRRLIDLHRRRERRPETTDIEAEYDMAGSDAHQLETVAEARLATRALKQLTPDERKVVLMSTYHGFSHSQISEQLGMPLGTVKTYIRRGLRRVREALRGSAEQELPA